MSFEPMSSVLLNVKDPVSEPTLVPLQFMTASMPIVALSPAADALPPTVAADLVPFPVASRPLLPGAPRASAAPVPGPSSASAVMLATASQPALRNVVARFRRVEYVFIRRYPRELRRECRE